MLAAPTTYNEIPVNHNGCGQCCGASIASDWTNRVITEQSFGNVIGTQSVTSQAQLIAGLRQFGVPCAPRNEPMSSYLPRAISQQHEVILLHQCNGYAQPVPRGTSSIAHWRVGYGTEVAMMNPWGGVNQVIDAWVMDGADLNCGIEIMGVMPKDEGDDMGTPYTINCWMADIHLAYREARPAAPDLTEGPNGERLYYEALYSTPSFDPNAIILGVLAAGDAKGTSVRACLNKLESAPPSGLTLEEVKQAIEQTKLSTQ